MAVLPSPGRRYSSPFVECRMNSPTNTPSLLDDAVRSKRRTVVTFDFSGVVTSNRTPRLGHSRVTFLVSLLENNNTAGSDMLEKRWRTSVITASVSRRAELLIIKG